MIRISLFLAFFVAMTTVSAQDSYSVFLDKSTVNWYQDAVVEYNLALKNLDSDDPQERVQSYKKMDKIIDLISNNCPSMCFAMDRFLDEEKIKAVEPVMTDGAVVNGLVQRNAQMRRNTNMAEIMMAREDLKVFQANIDKIIGVKEKLSRKDYKIAADVQNRSLASTDKLMIISAAANANRDFLINKTVEN